MLRLTIQTGFLTCILAIAIIILYLRRIQGWNIFTYAAKWCFLPFLDAEFILVFSRGFLLGKSSVPFLDVLTFIDDRIRCTCSYVMTLLANLNARSSNIPKPELMAGNMGLHISTMVFAPRQNPVLNETNSSFSSHLVSVIRSATHTAHHTLTTSQIEGRESQFDNTGTAATDPRLGGGCVSSFS